MTTVDLSVICPAKMGLFTISKELQSLQGSATMVSHVKVPSKMERGNLIAGGKEVERTIVNKESWLFFG